MRLQYLAQRLRNSCIAATLIMGVNCPVIAQEPPVGISCEFVDSIERDGRLDGLINVEVSNLSQGALRNLLVRFSPQSDAYIHGEIRQASHLSPGAVEVLAGTFSIPASLLSEQAQLFWEVRYHDGAERVIEVSSELCGF